MSTRTLKRWLAALVVACAVEALYIYVRLTHGVPSTAYQAANRPGVIYWHGSTDRNAVALTFDDGPSMPYTAQLLAILDANHVRATFFMIGKNVEQLPAAAKAVADAGHAIGNHTFGHPNLNFERESQVGTELARAESAITAATGMRPRLFRPPYGDVDRFTLHESRQLGYVAVEWSVSSKDWQMPGSDAIVANVLRDVHNGAIILMHDGGGDRSQTVEAVARLIPELQQRGYELVTVPELLGLPQAR
ncbi:MAG TPA: polysaccharide deacetylase family protein [Kofleriaceae bacterium]|nr:polysaccharide deacetylase family protein [Kofleriaceae bacterium]